MINTWSKKDNGIEQFSGKFVFLNTAPVIYFIEGLSQYQQKLQRLFELNDAGKLQFMTSAIDIFDITIPVAIKAAELRAKYNIHTPDALQVAIAFDLNADYFLTNDLRLKSV